MGRRGILAFVVPGGLGRVTGGNLYDRAVISGLRGRGWNVAVLPSAEAVDQADLVILDSLALPYGPPSIGAPIVALVHQLPRVAGDRADLSSAEGRTLQASRLVVVVSEWLRRPVQQLTDAPIQVIRPGRDRVSARVSSLERGLALCVANGSPGKGVPEAINAVGIAGGAGVTLVVAGDSDVDPAEGRRIREAAARSACTVNIAGPLGPVELADLYSKARVIVLASVYEGWPIAVAEAMSNAIPVAGFAVPGMSELVRSGVDGTLVGVGDVSALAKAVAEFLRDRDLAARLGRSGRRRALRWPTWSDTMDLFARTVESI